MSDHIQRDFSWMRLWAFAFSLLLAGLFFQSPAKAQVCGPTFTCQQAGFPDCYTCVNGACDPDDTFCQGRSGGDSTDNICRIGICIPNITPNTFNPANPSGCNYVVDPTPDPSCEQCNSSSAPFANHCPNGACEPGLGEDPTTCPIDCLVPGMTPTPLPTQTEMNNACAALGITFQTFNGPPFNVGGSGQCEDGNVCTTDICATPNPTNGFGTCNHVPDACSGDVSDLCCPSGCIPVPAGAATCREAFDLGLITQAQLADCDRDCKAIPCPTPTPTPIPVPTPTPPVFGLCLQGDGVASGSNGKLDCKGFTCSLNPASTETVASALGLSLLGGALAALAIARRRHS